MRYDRGLLYSVGGMKDRVARREVIDMEKFANRILEVQTFTYAVAVNLSSILYKKDDLKYRGVVGYISTVVILPQEPVCLISMSFFCMQDARLISHRDSYVRPSCPQTGRMMGSHWGGHSQCAMPCLLMSHSSPT